MQKLRLSIEQRRARKIQSAMQHLAVVLYRHGLSLRAVARLLRTTATSVQRWVKILAEQHGQRPEPEPGGAVIMELDNRSAAKMAAGNGGIS